MRESFFERFQSADNKEPLVTLIRLTQEEPEIKTWLTGILSLDNFNRKSALNTLLDQLILQQAPSEFIAALGALLDDRIAARTLAIITDGESGPGD